MSIIPITNQEHNFLKKLGIKPKLYNNDHYILMPYCIEMFLLLWKNFIKSKSSLLTKLFENITNKSCKELLDIWEDCKVEK